MQDNDVLSSPFYLLLDKKADDLKSPAYTWDDLSPLEYFGPLTHINIFVGANNSGKSRFMRGLIKSEKIVLSTAFSFLALRETLSNCLDQFSLCWNDNTQFQIEIKCGKRHGVLFNSQNKCYPITQQYFYNIKSLLETPYSQDQLEKWVVLFFVLDSLHALCNDIVEDAYDIYVSPDSKLDIIRAYSGVENELVESRCLLKTFLNSLVNSTVYKNLYAPIFRSAHSIYHLNSKVNSTDPFAETIHKNYFSELHPPKEKENEHHDLESGSQIIKIYTGMNLHEHILKIKNSSDPQRRKNFKDFENFIGKHFFDSNQVEVIPEKSSVGSTNDEHIYFSILNGTTETQPLHHLGDGVQAIIILLYTVFTAEENAWIYIEEPDISLHPGLQRTFLEAVIKQAKDKQLTVFITTHSNHLLDIAIDNESSSIFTFTKESVNSRLIRHVLKPNNSILGLLGVNNSSVFMANCSIWVEGHTDRKYIKGYLELYTKSLRKNDKTIPLLIEDLDYTFLIYAGSNIMHFLFEETETNDIGKEKISALSISNNILLIADRDGANKDADHKERSEKADKANGFKYYVLNNAREMENTLPQKVLSNIIPRVFKEIKKDDMHLFDDKYLSETEPLGSQLSSIFGGNRWKKSYGESTIGSTYKGMLAVEAIKELDKLEFSDLTKDAQELAKQVYSFIMSSKKAKVT